MQKQSLRKSERKGCVLLLFSQQVSQAMGLLRHRLVSEARELSLWGKSLQASKSQRHPKQVLSSRSKHCIAGDANVPLGTHKSKFEDKTQARRTRYSCLPRGGSWLHPVLEASDTTCPYPVLQPLRLYHLHPGTKGNTTNGNLLGMGRVPSPTD